MTNDRLRLIIGRYTPMMFDDVIPAPAAEVDKLRALSGQLPATYVEFLTWMGHRCPFLEGEDLAYAPEDLVELVEQSPDIEVLTGFVLIGVDRSGGGYDLHIRRSDGWVARINETYRPGSTQGLVLENVSLAAYLTSAYVRHTLVPSHTFHFAAALAGDEAQIRTVLLVLGAACRRMHLEQDVEEDDIWFFGGKGFVAFAHRRPGSASLVIHVGALDRASYEVLYDLVFERWRCVRMPV